MLNFISETVKAVAKEKEVIIAGGALALGTGLVVWGGTTLVNRFFPKKAVEIAAEVVAENADKLHEVA